MAHLSLKTFEVFCLCCMCSYGQIFSNQSLGQLFGGRNPFGGQTSSIVDPFKKIMSLQDVDWMRIDRREEEGIETNLSL